MSRASLHHAAAMAAIHAAAFPEDSWSEAAFASLLGQPGVMGWLDDAGGMVLLRCVADEAEILTIGVSLRRRGLGRRLLQAALGDAHTNGVDRVFLEVAADNVAAFALYAAAGFVQAGRRADYYGDGQDALVLRLEI